MIESVKITLLLCLTGVTLCVLVLSYGEYTNRYAIVATQNNGIYIFDKKTVTLNKCENGKCEVIRANFPSDRLPLGSAQTQAVAVNGINSLQNVSPAPVYTGVSSETPTSVIPPSGSNTLVREQNLTQTNVPQQNSVTDTTNVQTLKPSVNSFLNASNQLPTLQSSLQQSTYAYQA